MDEYIKGRRFCLLTILSLLISVLFLHLSVNTIIESFKQIKTVNALVRILCLLCIPIYIYIVFQYSLDEVEYSEACRREPGMRHFLWFSWYDEGNNTEPLKLLPTFRKNLIVFLSDDIFSPVLCILSFVPFYLRAGFNGRNYEWASDRIELLKDLLWLLFSILICVVIVVLINDYFVIDLKAIIDTLYNITN